MEDDLAEEREMLMEDFSEEMTFKHRTYASNGKVVSHMKKGSGGHPKPRE